MAEELDQKVSAAYRALGADEPPHALDEAILAASRRAAAIRPGRPTKSWTQRWAVPFSLAAVVVLSVVVTLRVQEEQPEIASVQAPAPAPAAPQAAPQAAPPETLKLKVEDRLKSAPKPAPRSAARNAEPKPFPQARSDRAPAASGLGAAQAPAAPPPAAEGALASRPSAERSADMRYGDSALRREEERVERDAEAAARAPQAAAALAKRAAAAPPTAAKPATAKVMAESADKPAVAQTPERELERIARLRAEGKHDQADKALAEFRKRYPDYRIAEDMLRRVERR